MRKVWLSKATADLEITLLADVGQESIVRVSGTWVHSSRTKLTGEFRLKRLHTKICLVR